MRVRAEVLELYVGTSCALTLPRLNGRFQARIDYHHLIFSLIRKPGAFAQYRYRDELFPSLTFRTLYDTLVERQPSRADREYLRILHLAASTSEADVEAALLLLRESRSTLTFNAVRELVHSSVSPQLPPLSRPQLDFQIYDALLSARCAHG